MAKQAKQAKQAPPRAGVKRMTIKARHAGAQELTPKERAAARAAARATESETEENGNG